MDVPQNTVVAVVDGENFDLYKNTGDAGNVKLRALETPDTEDRASSGGRSSSSANPDASQAAEDAFGKGVVEKLNQLVLKNKIEKLIIVAAPRSLGEMRRSYHKQLQEVLLGELDKVLTGHSIEDIEKALAAA